MVPVLFKDDRAVSDTCPLKNIYEAGFDASMFGDGELALRHRHACARILHALCTQAKSLNICTADIYTFCSANVCGGDSRSKEKGFAVLDSDIALRKNETGFGKWHRLDSRFLAPFLSRGRYDSMQMINYGTYCETCLRKTNDSTGGRYLLDPDM